MQQQDLINVFNFEESLDGNNLEGKKLDTNFIYQIYDINYLNEKELFNDKMNIFLDLKNKFITLYKNEFCFISRAPGRVNIIGEHIDYAGFSVLPMAICNDILIACSIESKKEVNLNNSYNNNIILEINHINSDLYKSFTLNIDRSSYKMELIKPHNWLNYIIAGFNSIIKGLLELDNQILNNIFKDISKINLLVTGNIPCSSGLSSSSALTVASALAALKILRIENKYSKFEIANATINYERSVGTACGGMDQTISICGEKNRAKLIEFTPHLNTKNVDLPNNISFVIANSLTESTKINTLAFRYNKRVVENKLALAVISAKLKLNYIPEILIELKNNCDNKQLNYIELAELISNNLKNEEYSLDEIKKELGKENLKIILQKVPYYEDVLEQNKNFALKNRLLHVCSEAERVEKFYELCSNPNKNTLRDENEKSRELAKLMNESHFSCKELYECSSYQLDKLVDFSVANGALGARLTGAGWGGCCVIMVENILLSDFLLLLKKYYEENFNLQFSMDICKVEDYFFYTKASQGACIINRD